MLRVLKGGSRCVHMGLILSWEKLSPWREGERKAGRRVVATNGCFDLLHVGHVRFLQEAKRRGDVLVVGVNGDKSVAELKGDGRPINGEAERAEVVAALGCVDAVVIFSEKRATKFLEGVRPDIYVKGGDYREEQLDQDEVGAVKRGGGKVEVLPLTPGRSTTAVLQKMKA